jgi:uncharacterized protein YecT (DUF1311 family)
MDLELNRVYQLALARIADNDPGNDVRKSTEQLRKSERAWLVYMREDCALKGGLEGGSNAWVSTFISTCQVERTKERITFLMAVADGAFRH